MLLVFLFVSLSFFWLYFAACEILVLQPGRETTPSSVESWSLNHWTAREVSRFLDTEWRPERVVPGSRSPSQVRVCSSPSISVRL